MNNENLKKQLKKLTNGDSNTFFIIYEDMKIPIYTIIYRILYDRTESEDVMQDIFLRLFKTPPSLHIKNPRAWIFQMARNLAIDCKRKRRDDRTLPYQVKSEDFPMENKISIRMDVELALQQLSAEDREIVTLHLNGDLKFREIAELTQRPLGTVLWRYRKAIGKLRYKLS